MNHCCINVATYGPGGRFAMTDRGRGALDRTPETLTVGPSSMRWDGDRLIVEVDEISSPPRVSRMRGRITFIPDAVTGAEIALTPDRAHLWRPVAPSGRIEVDLGPGGTWTGHGYHDFNAGTRALEADFSYWTWGRYPLSDGTKIFYDATLRDGTRTGAALGIARDGTVIEVDAPPVAPLARSGWRVRRETRADEGYRPQQVLPMLDTPFYTRASVRTRIDGQESVGMHEALDLDRFRGPWLMPLLAVRVPRRARWRG